ncbi:hypothetical protein ACXIVC_21765 [Vibrio parahaemolyticus]|nr:hypothetical protein [Vibrio alginolyticus]
MRLSKPQKELLIIMTKAFMSGIREVKSTDAHALVCRNLKKDIHPNNWRDSCKVLHGHGLIRRFKEKDGFDWFMHIKPEGINKGVELIELAEEAKEA